MSDYYFQKVPVMDCDCLASCPSQPEPCIIPPVGWQRGAMAGERVQRLPAAILAADIAGYSRLMLPTKRARFAHLKSHRHAQLDRTDQRRGFRGFAKFGRPLGLLKWEEIHEAETFRAGYFKCCGAFGHYIIRGRAGVRRCSQDRSANRYDRSVFRPERTGLGGRGTDVS